MNPDGLRVEIDQSSLFMLMKIAHDSLATAIFSINYNVHAVSEHIQDYLAGT